jgi:hypothetical protein
MAFTIKLRFSTRSLTCSTLSECLPLWADSIDLASDAARAWPWEATE